MNNTNNFSARESFQHAKNLFFNAMKDKFNSEVDAWNWVNGLKLSQSEIRLEVELNAENNIFTFAVNPQQVNTTNVNFPTENRLQLQDSLVVNEYGIYVAKPLSRVDIAFELKTYPDNVAFTAAQLAALNGFFNNGSFQIKCNNDVIAPYRGLFNHLYKPQTQQTAALGDASPAAQIRGAEDGMITMEPNLLLIGSKNYQPQLVLPGSMASVAEFTRAVIIFRGVLAQNSTVVN